MSGIIKQKEKTPQQLKEFGQVMAIASLVFSCLLVYKKQTVTLLLFALLLLALIFLLFATFLPRALKVPEYYWMKFAEKLGTVMTFLIMFITFYCVFMPIGILLRIIGKDLLQRKLNPNATTYWEKTSPITDNKRYYTPF